MLAQSLLPPYGRGLDAAFGSEGYAEFVGYVGIAALVLAAIGLSLLWRRTAKTKRPPWNVQSVTLLAASDLLAFGTYNPLYYLLWRVIPGFNLFRAPARWLELLRWVRLRSLRSGWIRWSPRRHEDAEDTGTRGHGDTATRRHDDKGTRRGTHGVGADIRQLHWRSCCSPR